MLPTLLSKKNGISHWSRSRLRNCWRVSLKCARDWWSAGKNWRIVYALYGNIFKSWSFWASAATAAIFSAERLLRGRPGLSRVASSRGYQLNAAMFAEFSPHDQEIDYDIDVEPKIPTYYFSKRFTQLFRVRLFIIAIHGLSTFFLHLFTS